MCWEKVLVLDLVVIVAAILDARTLRIPNKLTFGLIISGVGMSVLQHGTFMTEEMYGAIIAFFMLLPAYAAGGMGAADVKLLTGVGAWVGWHVVPIFVITAVSGAVVACILVTLKWGETRNLKSSLEMRMPYGVPIAIGVIVYFPFFMDVWKGFSAALRSG